MEFFLDTANLDEIREANDLGLLDGVTTNPTLVAREGRGFLETIEAITAIVGDRPVNAECVARDAEGLIQEGRQLASIAPNIVVKIPLDLAGLKAARVLSSENIAINHTLCFSAPQALLSAKSGASYISPFVGRLDDIGQLGMALIKDIRTIYDNYGFSTKVLVASVRTPTHVLEAALIGADIATVPFKVFTQLVQHPLTDSGIQRFLDDFARIPREALQG
jgi:transaldolase